MEDRALNSVRISPQGGDRWGLNTLLVITVGYRLKLSEILA